MSGNILISDGPRKQRFILSKSKISNFYVFRSLLDWESIEYFEDDLVICYGAKELKEAIDLFTSLGWELLCDQPISFR